MLELLEAKNGTPFLKSGRRLFNSRYNPESEASSFIGRSVDTDAPTLIVIVGETLGYLTKETVRRFPATTIISVFLSNELESFAFESSATLLFPDSPDFPGVVSSQISENNVEGLSVLSWEPSMKEWPDTGEKVLKAIRASVRFATGNITTTAAFGARWLTNMVTNLTELPGSDFRYTHYTPQKPVLLAASGPSLEAVLDDPELPADEMEIWALPSSVPALYNHSLVPKLIITTDPGRYAACHYRGFHRFPEATIALPLTARPGLASHPAKFALLHQHTFFESELFPRIVLPHTPVPANGTVAGTAFELAYRSGAQIFLAGLDLSTMHHREHARPHPFPTLHLLTSSRTTPYESIHTRRILDHYPESNGKTSRTSSPLRTYADWFSQRCQRTEPGRVFRISPSSVTIEGCPTLEPRQIRQHIALRPTPEISTDSSPRANISTARAEFLQLLERWKTGLQKYSLTLDVLDTPSAAVEGAPRIELLFLLSTRTYLRAKKHISSENLFSGKRELKSACENALAILDKNIQRLEG